MNGYLWSAVVLAALATTTAWLASRGSHRVTDVGTMLLAIALATFFGIPAVGCVIIGLMF
jgi:hypothetical protein